MMKARLILSYLLAVFLVFSFTIAAPSMACATSYEAWAQRYNGPGDLYDNACAIAVDASGNVYVTGVSYGGDHFAGGTDFDYATVKYDTDGNQLWIQRYNGPGNWDDSASAIALDSSGNIYVTGDSLGSWPDYNYATIKYAPDGTRLWVQRYTEIFCRAYALAVDSSGNVYVTGYGCSSETGTGCDYLTVKYDTNGNQLWAKRYNGSESSTDQAHAIAIDTSGNVYVTGWSYDGSGTSWDYATVKYDTNGNELWVQRYNGPGNAWDEARAIAVDSLGNVYVTGRSNGIGTNYDYATVKYDTNGNELWVQRYNAPENGDDVARAMAVDTSENIYVTGSSEGSGTGGDYATVKYAPNGTRLWVQRYNGSGNGDDSAGAIAIDASENVYVTGGSYGGSGTGGHYATVKYDSAGNQLWVARYNGPGNASDLAGAIALDALGNVYVTGESEGGNGANFDYATIKYSQSNTYAGGVPVDAGNGVTVTFDEVTEPGNTIATITDQGPSPPTGFQIAGTYYEITTTATYDGLIKICIVYDDSNLSEGQERNLSLQQHDGATDTWVDITTSCDTVNNIICSKTGQLSLFGLMYPVYQFSGFLPPVSLGKPCKLGRTVPVKFQLTDAMGNYITTALATLTLQQYIGEEPVGDPIVPTSPGPANTGNIFRYDLESNQYIYNLSTKGLQRATYLMIVALDDGEEHTTFISFR